jgi:antitoxin component of RelBE/YafQ-DinJ toxin-antitoxin module
MSKLEELTKESKKKNKNVTVTAKIPQNVYLKFKEKCEELGISVNEALNLLLADEVKNITEESSKNVTKNLSNDSSKNHSKKSKEEKEEDFYLLRKTAKEGKAVRSFTVFNEGTPIEWCISPEQKAHYDADGNIIPFRFTSWDGLICDPNEEELKQLEIYYGKPVKIEK